MISADAIDVLDDVRTIAAGSILVDAAAGDVRVADGGDADSDGIQSVDGDILVRAGANLTVDATIQSQRGDIGLVAQGNVEQRVGVNTGAGNLLARAGGSFTMDANSRLVAGESLNVISDTSSIQLGLVSAVNVAIRAQTSIIDGNAADELNVTASKLSMRALTGSIGQPAPGNPPSTNPNAIDTRVLELAAFASEAVYVQEIDGVVINRIDAVPISIDNIQRVNFRSNPTSAVVVTATVDSIDDLTSGGALKLVTLNGSITVQDGMDSDGTGIESTSAGDVFVRVAIGG